MRSELLIFSHSKRKSCALAQAAVGGEKSDFHSRSWALQSALSVYRQQHQGVVGACVLDTWRPWRSCPCVGDSERLQPSASAHAFLAFRAPGWTQPSPACLPLSSELQPILRPLPSLLHTGRDSSASGALTPAPRLHLPEPPGVSVDITSCRKPSLIPLCSHRGSTVSALCRLCILFRLLLQTSAELSNS